MFAFVYLGLVGVLAYQLRTRVALLDGFTGAYRYFLSLGLTLFLVNWLNFLLYVACGWSRVYLPASWAALLAPILYFAFAPDPGRPGPPDHPWSDRMAGLLGLRWNWWFLGLLGFVLLRFYIGLDSDENNDFWSTFNFDDTAFHLSVANALLNAPRFPPMDLDMAPYPLKYHFLADFWLAHLQRLGMRAVIAIFAMNCLSAAVMVGALWAVLQKWLKLPPRWILLACLIFFYLSTALVNVVHYVAFKPEYFRPESLFDGLLLYPYFNFESAMTNLFNPQRGLLFTFPVALLVLDAVFGGGPAGEAAAGPAAERGPVRTLQALVLVCLLPFAHIVSFAVLACCLLPRLWEHRRWLLWRAWAWLPALALGTLQLLYFVAYGPPTHTEFSSWNVAATLPLHEFAAVPPVFRRALFWFFIDGDFLAWGGLFAAWALLRRRPSPDSPAEAPLRDFLRRWWWYFAVGGLVFVGVNCFRYSPAWGDSNKFILFLNFGLTMVIVLGAAELGGPRRWLSRGLWWFFLVLCAFPPVYKLGGSVLAEPYGSVVLFQSNDRAAARWLRTSTKPSEIVLTGAYGSIHFVSSLAGRPVLAGLYGESNPYRQDGREEAIRRVYEEGDLSVLRELNPRYVCISRYERYHYKLNPCWQDFIKKPGVLLYRAGPPGDLNAVVILDAWVLLRRAPPKPAPVPGP